MIKVYLHSIYDGVYNSQSSPSNTTPDIISLSSQGIIVGNFTSRITIRKHNMNHITKGEVDVFFNIICS